MHARVHAVVCGMTPYEPAIRCTVHRDAHVQARANEGLSVTHKNVSIQFGYSVPSLKYSLRVGRSVLQIVYHFGHCLGGRRERWRDGRREEGGGRRVEGGEEGEGRGGGKGVGTRTLCFKFYPLCYARMLKNCTNYALFSDLLCYVDIVMCIGMVCAL